MNRRTTFQLTVASLVCAAVAFSAGNAPAQKSLKEQVTGAWTLVSIDNIWPDGKKIELWGSNPKGILVFDASGRYVLAQALAGRAHFKSTNRLKASTEESTAALRDTLHTFGTWSVDEGSKTIVLRAEGHSVPNSIGAESKRVVTSITADELRFTNPTAGVGGTNETVYRRAK